jgi:hypothetical protein
MPNVEVVHALPNRVHLRAAGLAHQRDACLRVARKLAEEPAHGRVSVRPQTGSVIVESEDATLDAHEVARRLAGLVDAEVLARPRPFAASRTRLARAIGQAAHEINNDVRSALDDKADLGTLLSMGFAIGGLSEVAVKGTLPVPSWFNLLWWSLRSFMTFNVDTAPSSGAGAPAPENGARG